MFEGQLRKCDGTHRTAMLLQTLLLQSGEPTSLYRNLFYSSCYQNVFIRHMLGVWCPRRHSVVKNLASVQRRNGRSSNDFLSLWPPGPNGAICSSRSGPPGVPKSSRSHYDSREISGSYHDDSYRGIVGNDAVKMFRRHTVPPSPCIKESKNNSQCKINKGDIW